MTRLGRSLAFVSIIALAGTLICCTASKDEKVQAVVTSANTPIALPAMTDSKPLDYPGIHNAVAYHPGYISGSVPEGEAGFETLAAMGVKTIISVDGAEPEVAKAAAHGMRYIHLPIGYNGFDEEKKLQLVRASRDAMASGPVYIHCHHGKHRSAGAAASVAASLGWETPERGVERMKVSGTAAHYKGLYACASNSSVIAPHVINSVPANFPSVSKPSGYVKGMVEIDEIFEHLKAIEKAGWRVPAEHPDLVPVAEAGRLADLYRVLNELEYSKRKPEEFRGMMAESNNRAQKLEDLLAAGEKDTGILSAQFKLVAASCKDCHVKYRD